MAAAPVNQVNEAVQDGAPGTPPRRSTMVLTMVLTIVAALTVGAGASWWFTRAAAGNPNGPPMLLKVEQMGRLVSLKLHYAEIVEINQKRSLGIPWSQWQLDVAGTRVLLVAKGDCLLATDMNGAKYENVDAARRTLLLVLPAPQPFQPRINHDSRERGGSYFYSISNRGVEALIPDSGNRTAAIDHALAWAQADVKRACGQPQLIDSARRNAEAVLRASFQASGWTPAFKWR